MGGFVDTPGRKGVTLDSLTYGKAITETHMQSEEREQAYEAGLKKGRAIIAGITYGAVGYDDGRRYYRDKTREVASALGCPVEAVVARVFAFHKERLDAVPDLTRYPELRGERDLLFERYRGMVDAGLSKDLVALAESLVFWQDYRLPVEEGKSFYGLATERKLREQCRVIYMPESDRGAIHAKNVDAPLKGFIPDPPITNPGPWPFPPLMPDGAGSGLHIDEIPPEIFPADAVALCPKHCTTVDEATEFLVRYCYFWGGCNRLVHDDKGNSMAFEKTSRCRVATRGPDSNGINYVTGMGAVDAELAEFIDRQRELYLRETGQDDDCYEATYWRKCKGQFRSMARYMKELSETPTVDKLIEVLLKRDPDGPLCKDGVPCHADEATPEATLLQRVMFLDEKKVIRRQWRGDVPVWEDPWEVIQYG